MRRACIRESPRKTGWTAVLLMVTLSLCAPPVEGRGPKKGERTEKAEEDVKAARPEKGERREKRRKGKKGEEGQVLEAAAPCLDEAARCESRLAFLLFEDADKPRPLARFRYHFRIGDKLVEGSCPGQDSLARCLDGGVALVLTPEQLAVVFEVDGFRPLLQEVTPAYQLARSGCATPCRQAELRLYLRRETGEIEEP